jgi:2-succinyl-5-enolpyruvyl-6-hydroxy-3-cyclohexene-1-carboxylate synthase
MLSLLSKTPQIIIDHPGEAKNPSLGPATFLSANRESSALLLAEIAKILKPNKEWCSALHELEQETEKALDEHLAKDVFTEWQWLRQAHRYLSEGANIFVGNSMQIRDLDAVFPKQNGEHEIYSNRGLSGIDGILSTAIGVAAAKKTTTHLFVGDLTAIHDINALSLAKRISENISLTIWLQNNGGGEIFRMVKTAEAGAPEECFTTPQIVDFASLAKGFGISFMRVTKLSDLDDLGPEAFSGAGLRIVELIFSGTENMQCRKKFWESFRE